MTIKVRKSIPKLIQKELLYNSVRTCCVCRNGKSPIQIHHIDQDPSNNDYTNLIVICSNCHDESHTQHKMTKNLTASDLKYSKEEWELQVKERASMAMLPSSISTVAMWTFINHEKLPRILQNLGILFKKELFNTLLHKGVIDTSGVPCFQKNSNKSQHITVYDRMEWDCSQQFHNLYMEAVDNLIKHTNPLELRAIWTKTEFKKMIKPGAICFVMRGFHFQGGKLEDHEEIRFIYARAYNIEIRMYANTRHMYGDSALLGHFTGHTVTAMLMLVKNLEIEGNKLVLNVTPLAMGSGYSSGEYDTPHHLRTGWPC